MRDRERSRLAGARVGDENGEFVTPQAGDEVGIAERGADAHADFVQQRVSHMVTERIVYPFEAVEVHDRQRHRRSRRSRALEHRLDSRVERCAVRKAGQRVMKGLMLQCRFDPAAFGDVGSDRDHAGDGGTVAVHGVQRISMIVPSTSTSAVNSFPDSARRA